jgi:hypothetical protein
MDDLSGDNREEFEDYMNKLDKEAERWVHLALHGRSPQQVHSGEGSGACFFYGLATNPHYYDRSTMSMLGHTTYSLRPSSPLADHLAPYVELSDVALSSPHGT